MEGKGEDGKGRERTSQIIISQIIIIIIMNPFRRMQKKHCLWLQMKVELVYIGS